MRRLRKKRRQNALQEPALLQAVVDRADVGAQFDGGAQVGAGLADLVQPSSNLDETLLDDILGFGIAAHEGVGEANHADVLAPVEPVEYVGMLVPIRGLRALAMFGTRVLLLPLKVFDLWLNRLSKAHVLASTTFVHAVKAE